MKVVSYSKNTSKQNELGYPSQKFGEIFLLAKIQDGQKKIFNKFLAFVFAIRCGNKCFYLCVLAQGIKLR